MNIYRNLTVAVFALATLGFQAMAQTFTGIINDENGAPMEFATVALCTLPDTSAVTGTVTDIDGKFEMTGQGDLIQVSMIGYRTTVLPVSSYSDGLVIRMRQDSQMLEEAVVSASLPKTELKGDAVVTNIAGSVLQHSGNALDVLGKIPGMISKDGNLEVIGRGAPLYYINGRKVTDNSDLRNLMSEDIKSIDVVSNPGAAYGGEVRAVVRIRTIKHQGDGFSFALTSQARQHLYNCKDFEPSWSVLDLNYRKKGWDFFGKLVYWNQRGYQISDIYGGTVVAKDYGIKTNVQEGDLDYRGHNGGFQYVAGANWQINDDHSLGAKVELSDNNIGNSRLIMDDDVFTDGVKIDHVYAVNDSNDPTNRNWSGNLYYDGNIQKLHINFNADFVSGRNDRSTVVNETSWATPAYIESGSVSKTDMGAGKLILSHPIWKGTLQAGAEETYVYGGQVYNITKIEIPSSDFNIRENTVAGFLEYGFGLPFGQISAGIRYEHVNYDYMDNLDSRNNLNRVQNNWFPSFSFSAKAGQVGFNLGYTGKTVRPRYSQLTSEITYDNRFTYQTGDPKMLNEIQRTLSLNVNWKFLTFTGMYENVQNSFYQKAYPWNDDGVAMIQYANVKDPLNKLCFYLNASPTIGVWHPNYTIGIEQQFFKTAVIDPRVEGGTRNIDLDAPMYLVQANNAFRFKHGWVLEADYQYVSPFNQLIAEIEKPMHNLSMAVGKSFLKNDALNFRLTFSDILNRNVIYFRTDYGNCFVRQSNDRFSPCIQLQISYRFNSADSKYKGTGAGQSAKNRM